MFDESPPKEIVDQFRLADLVSDDSVERVGEGHVNSTFLLGAGGDGPQGSGRVVLQRINTDVFTDPDGLMSNAVAVSDLVTSAGGSSLRFLMSDTDAPIAIDYDGRSWRAYRHVPGHCHSVPANLDEVGVVASAFGRFAGLLTGAKAADFHMTIERFHDLDRRVEDLEAVIALDPVGRVAERAVDLERARDLVGRFQALDEWAAWPELPIRLAHHDAKAANVVHGLAGTDGVAGTTTVIDLDTVMAGTIMSDVGELVRSCARLHDEDDPAGVFIQERAEAAIVGFVSGWGQPMPDAERLALPAAGLWATIQNAIRFLADHLDGDCYFSVSAPDHNLRRFRSMAIQAEGHFEALDHLRRLTLPNC